jgi:hypothetical protein
MITVRDLLELLADANPDNYIVVDRNKMLMMVQTVPGGDTTALITHNHWDFKCRKKKERQQVEKLKSLLEKIGAMKSEN